LSSSAFAGFFFAARLAFGLGVARSSGVSNSGVSPNTSGRLTRTRVDCSSVARSSIARERGRLATTASRISRVVVETESEVALITPATDAPVSRRTPAMNRKTVRMWAPIVPARVVTTQSSVSPVIPPRVLTHVASHQSGRVPPGPTPSVPADRPSVTDTKRQTAPARNGRTAGRTGRSIRIAPPAASETGTRYCAAPSSQRRPSTASEPARPPSQPAYTRNPKNRARATRPRPIRSS
jgi:hypothetical protein